MFFSDSILSKKGGGALAKVWLAAHWERKLSKSQFIQTNIQVSVGAIVGDTMALRLSGQLLLGVVRIYSRKARYLLEDCNEALVKIKMAFRPGVVDMPDEQTMAHFNAITVSETINEFDILLPEPSFNINNFNNISTANEDLSYSQRQDTIPSSQSQNVSRQSDITIREQPHHSQSITNTSHLALPSSSTGLDLLDIEHGMDAAGAGGDEDLLSFDFGGSVGGGSSTGFLGFEGESREIEVGRDAARETSFRLDDSVDVAADETDPTTKTKGADAMDLDLENEFGAGDLEVGLDNRISSVGVFGGGIDEMSFDVERDGGEKGVEDEASATGWNGYEDDPIPLLQTGEDEFERMSDHAFGTNKENELEEGENPMFDAALTPTEKRIKGIKKSKVVQSEKTPTKRATKPANNNKAAHVAKKRKVAVPDEMTQIPAKQIMEQLANTSSITVMETYLPTSQQTIDALSSWRNKDFLRPMHAGLNPKLSGLFSTNTDVMPMGQVNLHRSEDDGNMSIMREELVVFGKDKSISEKEKQQEAEEEIEEDEIEKGRQQNDETEAVASRSMGRSSEVPEDIQGWNDDADRAFPEDEVFAPMDEASLAFEASAASSEFNGQSLRMPSAAPSVTQEELESEKAADQVSVNDYLVEDLVEDDQVQNGEDAEEANVSLTNGASMSRSTMTTIELLQHKFATAESVTLAQLLPRKPEKSEAARMFFELLVLKTKNLIEVQQKDPFGSISVTEKPLLAAQIAV